MYGDSQFPYNGKDGVYIDEQRYETNNLHHNPSNNLIATQNPLLIMRIKKGTDFCAKNCISNETQELKKCYHERVIDCVPCKLRNEVQIEDKIYANLFCQVACNALVGTDTCDFYSFVGSEKKELNKVLLNRFLDRNFK